MKIIRAEAFPIIEGMYACCKAAAEATNRTYADADYQQQQHITYLPNIKSEKNQFTILRNAFNLKCT